MKTPFQKYSIYGLILFIITSISFFIFYSWYLESNPKLPKYGLLPNFRLTERSGKTITLDHFRNKVWVVDFIFTNCAGICPTMTMTMKELSLDIDTSKVRLVSITVDPDRDNLEALNSYADAFEAPKDQWLFLRDDKIKLYSLIKNGFNLPVSEESLTLEEPIIHSSKFVLIDKRFYIRGYYDSDEVESMNQLVKDIDKLVKSRY